jgi:hypothetical protein
MSRVFFEWVRGVWSERRDSSDGLWCIAGSKPLAGQKEAICFLEFGRERRTLPLPFVPSQAKNLRYTEPTVLERV